MDDILLMQVSCMDDGFDGAPARVRPRAPFTGSVSCFDPTDDDVLEPTQEEAMSNARFNAEFANSSRRTLLNEVERYRRDLVISENLIDHFERGLPMDGNPIRPAPDLHEFVGMSRESMIIELLAARQTARDADAEALSLMRGGGGGYQVERLN